MLETSFAFITIVVIGVPILIIFNLLYKKQIFFHVISVLALVYGAAVISVTFFPMPIDPRLIADMKINGVVLSYNLIPFKSISGSLNRFLLYGRYSKCLGKSSFATSFWHTLEDYEGQDDGEGAPIRTIGISRN